MLEHKRRVPSQKRSREKYDLVLETAKSLIGERGNDSVSMREIAKQAGVPISSIYQYFPDKNAILLAIMQNYFDLIRAQMQAYLESCESLEDFRSSLDKGFDLFYLAFKHEPALAILWAGLQANPQLKALDTADSHINADLICEKLSALMPGLDHQELHPAVLLLVNMSGTAVRLALDMPQEDAQAVLREFKTLSLLRLNALLEMAQGGTN